MLDLQRRVGATAGKRAARAARAPAEEAAPATPASEAPAEEATSTQQRHHGKLVRLAGVNSFGLGHFWKFETITFLFETFHF